MNSARKTARSQSALSQTEEAKDYLGGILESLSEAIIVVDPAGAVTMANAASGRMLGMKSDTHRRRGV